MKTVSKCFEVTGLDNDWSVIDLSYGFEIHDGCENSFVVLMSCGQNGKTRLIISAMGVDYSGRVLFDGNVDSGVDDKNLTSKIEEVLGGHDYVHAARLTNIKVKSLLFGS